MDFACCMIFCFLGLVCSSDVWMVELTLKIISTGSQHGSGTELAKLNNAMKVM